eukprot:NODE_8043_length_404_cov_100.684814.p3 GENE.NODE_8043_length_404_cov_100.684814~~NODE_8043_length_404_cov_100.684814.p3  ORF type:complete len:77 (-),score=14.03 NODE_8043_length_404_cov_100.684814:174-404(-)
MTQYARPARQREEKAAAAAAGGGVATVGATAVGLPVVGAVPPPAIAMATGAGGGAVSANAAVAAMLQRPAGLSGLV